MNTPSPANPQVLMVRSRPREFACAWRPARGALPPAAAGLVRASSVWLACAGLISAGFGCSADQVDSSQRNPTVTTTSGFAGQAAPVPITGAAGVSAPAAVGAAAGVGVAGRPVTVATGGVGAAGTAGSVPPRMFPIGMPPIGATAGVGATAGSGSVTMTPPVTMMAGAGAAGAGTTPAGSPPKSTSPTECPAPPAGSPDKAIQALNAVNELRIASGSGCMQLVPELVQSAQAHCDYQAMHRGNAMCMADAHSEISGCMGFTGANVQAREIAAGYPRTLAYTEVATTFGNNPVAAVPNWIDTVYHRIPLLDPWTVDMGYGGAAGCDVIDIGRGMSQAAADTIAVYPYDGQTNVPPTWNGLEGPAPPAPAGGWPSSYVMSIYAQRLEVTDHVLTRDGDTTPIAHTWLDKNNPGVASLRNYFGNIGFLYGAPFEANTKYRVKVVGSYSGGPLNVEWTFTTGTKRPFGF